MQKVLMKGNEAIAEAAIRAGCRYFFGYPITPQTEVAAYMSKKMPTIGGVFLQAESESRDNMVYGARRVPGAGHDVLLQPRHQLKAGRALLYRGGGPPALS
jgi:hypothetical protein